MEVTTKFDLKECPECGANVEGLIHHCNCCGKLLYPKKTMFSYMVYEAGAFFDIQVYLNKIFDELALIPAERFENIIQRIEFDFWCFPIRKKTGAIYYASTKRVIVTIRMEEEAYIRGTKQDKLTLLVDEIQRNIDAIQKRLQDRKIYVDDDLFLQIRTVLTKVRGETID